MLSESGNGNMSTSTYYLRRLTSTDMLSPLIAGLE
jgi:hypothetical protein